MPLEDIFVDADEANYGPESGYTSSGADGSYQITGLPYGNYKVNASGWDFFGPAYVREYWEEELDWDNADVVTLSAASPDATGIDFTLDELGCISGHVFKADGSTVIDDAVISVEAEGSSYRSAEVSQTDGSYEICRLMPGTYKFI